MSIGYSEEESKKKKVSSPAPVQAKEHTEKKSISMPGSVKKSMEKSFNADFSNVHMYESPSVSKQGFDAVAQGSSIGFAPGAFSTDEAGMGLLGHELSHVTAHARGETPDNGGALLKSSSLESRANSEGISAAAGGQVGGASHVTVPSSTAGASSGAPAQGGTKKALFGLSKEVKQKLVDSAPFVRQITIERGLNDLFVLRGNKLDAAEAAVNAGATPATSEGNRKGRVGRATDKVDSTLDGVGVVSDTNGVMGDVASEVSKVSPMGGIAGGMAGGLNALTGLYGGTKAIVEFFQDPSLVNFVDKGKDVLLQYGAGTVGAMQLAKPIGESAGAAFAAEGAIYGAKAIPGLSIAVGGLDMLAQMYQAVMLSKDRGAANEYFDKLKDRTSTTLDEVSFDLSEPDNTLKSIGTKIAKQRNAMECARKAISECDTIKGRLDSRAERGTLDDIYAAALAKKEEFDRKKASQDDYGTQLVEKQREVEEDETAKANMGEYDADKDFIHSVGDGPSNQNLVKKGLKKLKWRSFKKANTSAHGKMSGLRKTRQEKAKVDSYISTSTDAYNSANETLSDLDNLFKALGAMDYTRYVGRMQERYDLIYGRAKQCEINSKDKLKEWSDLLYGFSKSWDIARSMNVIKGMDKSKGWSIGFSAVTDALAVTAGALTLGGVTAPVGVVLGGLALVIKGIDLIRKNAAQEMNMRTNINQELAAKSRYAEIALHSSGLTDHRAKASGGYQGMQSERKYEIESVDVLVTDIVDEVYDRLTRQKGYTGLSGTHGASGTQKKKSVHGRETRRMYKRMIAFEMGAVSGFMTDLSNNIAVNRAAELLIKAGGERSTPHTGDGPAEEQLKAMGLMRKKPTMKGIFSRSRTPEQVPLPSLGDVAKRFGNTKDSYRTLVKPDNMHANSMVTKWQEELGVTASSDVDIDTEKRNYSDALKSDPDSGMDEEQKKRHIARKNEYLAQTFGARMVNRDSTLGSKTVTQHMGLAD